jgi:subtilisin family serine protease
MSDSATVDIRFRQPKRPFNRFGKGIMQSNSYNDTVPYSDAGLDGTGQVVGIGDSGLDEKSCYFRNGDGLEVPRSAYDDPTFDLSRRKVIQYIDYADSVDRDSGHGTHVCGTLAGMNVEESDLYDGHASGSKIAFFDMEDSEQPQKGLIYPTPMGNFFEPSRLAGANIHSDSWGGPYNFYDADTAAVDGYMYDNDKFLIVFAAGNDGADGYYSTGDPACSKNALTVGASLNSPNFEDVAWFSSLGPSFDNRIKPDVVAPGAYIFSAKSATAGWNDDVLIGCM